MIRVILDEYKEAQNPFLHSFGFKNPASWNFLKKRTLKLAKEACFVNDCKRYKGSLSIIIGNLQQSQTHHLFLHRVLSIFIDCYRQSISIFDYININCYRLISIIGLSIDYALTNSCEMNQHFLLKPRKMALILPFQFLTPNTPHN